MVICCKRSHIVSIVLALLVSLFAAAAVFQDRSHAPAAMVSVPFEDQPVSEKLLVYIFLNSIQEQSNQFYKPYYTIAPTVACYFTTVKELQEDAAGIEITFTIFPYLGPHDTIGKDEVTFDVGHSGNITDTRFKHLENDSLPDNLSHLENGALPPIQD